MGVVKDGEGRNLTASKWCCYVTQTSRKLVILPLHSLESWHVPYTWLLRACLAAELPGLRGDVRHTPVTALDP